MRIVCLHCKKKTYSSASNGFGSVVSLDALNVLENGRAAPMAKKFRRLDTLR